MRKAKTRVNLLLMKAYLMQISLPVPDRDANFLTSTGIQFLFLINPYGILFVSRQSLSWTSSIGAFVQK